MFCILVVPQLRAVAGLGHFALIVVLIAAAQVFIEGPRWQMVPAYGLATFFALAWSLWIYAQAGGIGGQVVTSRPLAVLAAVLGVLGLVISAALPALLPVFRFPRPGGPYQIGTVTYHWVDADRREIFSPDPDARRELMAQVWYPVQENASPARAPYVGNAIALSHVLTRLVRLPAFTLNHFQYVTTHAIPSAPMATDQPAYPVLIFLEGLDGFRQMNTFQVEELVSQGYVVVALDQPYAAGVVVFPDGYRVIGLTKEQMEPFIQQSLSPAEKAPVLNGQALTSGNIPYFAQDVSFTLDRLAALNKDDPNGILTGRLDLQHVGILGISLGAIVASEACHMEPRLQACLMMDAAMPADVVQAGLRQPAMWMTRDAGTMRLERRRAGGWSEAEIQQTLSTMRALFARSLPGNGYYVEAPGIFHLNFTDVPKYTPLASQLGFSGPIGARRAHDLINAYTLAFFGRHLLGRPAALLGGQYPGAFLETR